MKLPQTRVTKESKITQGEWKVIKNNSNPESTRSTGIKASRIWIGSMYFIADHPALICEESEANAEAICKAVNNTYGKGIDPEKIGELLFMGKMLVRGLNHSTKISEMRNMINTFSEALEEINIPG